MSVCWSVGLLVCQACKRLNRTKWPISMSFFNPANSHAFLFSFSRSFIHTYIHSFKTFHQLKNHYFLSGKSHILVLFVCTSYTITVYVNLFALIWLRLFCYSFKDWNENASMTTKLCISQRATCNYRLMFPLNLILV